MSGAITKLAMDGHPFAITGDSDLSYVDIDRAVVESQRNTKGVHRISDLLVQKVTGSNGQWDLGSADYIKFKSLATRSVTETFSASFITAEGYKVNTATAYIVIPSPDGIFTTREGKTEFEIHCTKWSEPKQV